MSQSWHFSPIARAPRPEDSQEDVDARFAVGYDNAIGELYDTSALSFADAFGRRHVYHIRCGRKIGGGRFCFWRADHPDGECNSEENRWEYP